MSNANDTAAKMNEATLNRLAILVDSGRIKNPAKLAYLKRQIAALEIATRNK